MSTELFPKHYLIDASGWLEGVRHCPSPNFGKRPVGSSISLLVVHNISLPPGQFGGDHIEQFFCNALDSREHPYFEEIAGLQVSAHALIRRNGDCTQFVSFLDRAWHAGRSCFDGVEECNDFSIGIELEGADDVPFEMAQYTTLAAICQAVIKRWPLVNPARITGHSDIAPGRKTDPGPAFDWALFHRTFARVAGTTESGEATP